jgi:transposase-like protein
MEKSIQVKKERTTTYSAQQKCQAVLAVWTGRRRHSEICQEFDVSLNRLQAWQEQAMESMLKAFEPRLRRQEDRGPILADPLQRMLERKLTLLDSRMARLSGKAAKAAPEKPTSNG